MVDILAGSRPIEIGRFQENEHRRLVFPVGDILHQYPDATFQVLHKRPQDDDAYPVSPDQISVDNGRLFWLLKAADLSYTGDGKCEVIAYSGTVIAKSIKYTVTVDSALGGSATPPDPWQGWVVQVKEDADRAEAAAELLENPRAEAVTLEPGSEATASYSEGVFTFGIPEGLKGDPGEDGQDGYSPTASVSKAGDTVTITVTDISGTTTATVSDGKDGADGKDGVDGFSPVASVSKSGSTATITITDKTGTTTAQVSDGQDGADGYSPTASVSKSGSTATISITDKNGTTTATVSDGANGQDGAPGQDGYTPIRGTDYWTAADKAEIVAEAESEFSEDISDIVAELSEQKSEIDSKAPVILRDASGDIVSFADGADNMPLSSCVVQIDPVQSGSGDPAPDNIRPLFGSTGCKISRTGKNLLPISIYSGTTYNKDVDETLSPTKTSDSWAQNANSISVQPSSNYQVWSLFTDLLPPGKYYANIEKVSSGTCRVTRYVCDRNFKILAKSSSSNVSSNQAELTLADYGYIGWHIDNGTDKTNKLELQINVNLSGYGYTPYAGNVYPINWQTAAGTAYKGTINPLTGALTVSFLKQNLFGEGITVERKSTNTTGLGRFTVSGITGIVIAQNSQPSTLICNAYKTVSNNQTYAKNDGIGTYSSAGTVVIYDTNHNEDTAETFAAYLESIGAYVVYPLITPQTYQLDPVQITALRESSIWADTGAVSIEYPADTRTYVDDAISAATDPDGNVVTVTGSTPSITGESGKRYVCGTVDSISITPPSTGIIDVVFTSGTTPAVLTASDVVWPGWFNPNSLDASTTYEINIQDGIYGAVMAWT